MNGFRANTNRHKWKYFNKGNGNRNGDKGKFGRKGETYKKNEEKNVEEIMDYLINISYILNEKYEKYFVHELKEDNLKKGNKCFGAINLNYSYNVEDDICILIKIKDEIKGSEKELADQRKCSKIMEKLIYYCFFLLKYNEKDEQDVQGAKDGGNGIMSMQCIEIYNHFLNIICRDYIKLALSSYASHFVQTVICVYSFFKKMEDKYVEELKKRNKGYQPVCIYFKEICTVTTEKIFTLMLHKSGTHVLRSFLYSLGGYLNINISNISFRKSKVRGTSTRSELKYVDKGQSKSGKNGGGDDLFYEYIDIIVQKVTEEIGNPKVSLPMKNLLYQYVFYDHGESINGANGVKQSAPRNGENHVDRTKKHIGDDKYIMESQSQHFIPPLLYHTYAVPALGTLFELLKEKNVECDKLVREIFLIEKTKKYFINKTRENNKCHDESPLKQMLNILIKMDGPSIMIEKLLKMNTEPIFYVFNVYILKNINSLVCDNAYSSLVIFNYLTLENITEEMFDLLMKNVDIDLIIRRKKFNILRRLFDLSQCYQRNCKLLLSALLRWLRVGSAVNAGSGKTDQAGNGPANNTVTEDSPVGATSDGKFLWICILCMRSYQDLHPVIQKVFIEQKKKEPCEEDGKSDSVNLNNYNFYDYIKVDTNGYYILTHILSFPKESITPVTNSFRQFCNFLKIVNGNVASQEDIDKYNNFFETFGGTHGGSENGDKGNGADFGDRPMGGGKQMEPEHTRTGNNYPPHKGDGRRVKPFIRKNADLRGNILLYFACDKSLSVLCEKIAHTFNLINEKYLRNFILLFKSEYKRIASHYVGAHTIVTFFKLGTDEVKKKILDSLVEGDINVFNGYIKNFMKLKEYKKTKTISTNSKKYLKAKEMFQDILATEKEKGGEAAEDRDIQLEDEGNDNDGVDQSHEEDNGDPSDEAPHLNSVDSEKEKTDVEGPPASTEKPGGEEDYMNLITDFIKNSKKKSRKRKKEKEKIEQVLGKKAK